MTTLQQYIFEPANHSIMARTMEGIINFWNDSAEAALWLEERGSHRQS